MGQTAEACSYWEDFLQYIGERTSAMAFENWIAPVHVVSWSDAEVVLQVPNIFVQEYLLANYKQELAAFLPLKAPGEPSIRFVVEAPESAKITPSQPHPFHAVEEEGPQINLNPQYRFETYIEGPSNQFVKSAAIGVASRPGRSYNPFFIHGGVGLGKTHILHAVGHYIREHSPKLKVQCITTEAFINELVDSLRNKRVDKMKRYYRSLDVLLVDDIQFLQNRLNFEEEFCGTFEALINRGGLVVIASDQPPGRLKLSERLIARMEWGLVASVNVPDLETRVAILQHKAEQRGLNIPQNVAFFIAEHIYNNVRQLEGAVNRLSAHCRLLDLDITEEFVEATLREMLQHAPNGKVSVETGLKSVATIFQVTVPDLKGSSRTKKVTVPRQVAMYLAREMVKESLMMIAASFGGRSHSTIIHAAQQISKKIESNETLRRQVDMCRRNIDT